MAHFAKLDENNIVLAIHCLHNNELLDENNNESEEKGINFLTNLHGHSNWKQTSYNKNFRKNFAFIGCKYDAEIDAFVALQPYPSWTLDANAVWQPPIPMPSDIILLNPYRWDEATTSWIRNPVPE